MNNHTLQRFFLIVLLSLAVGSPASATVAARPCPAAAVRPVAGAIVLADFGSFGNVFSSGGRTRIIQVCVAAMCLALFIMMRKLNG